MIETRTKLTGGVDPVEHLPCVRKLSLTNQFCEVRGFAAGSRRFEKDLNLIILI
jgi:hypothetical protein